MRKLKRFACLIFACAFVFTSVSFVSCEKDGGDTTTNGDTTDTETPTPYYETVDEGDAVYAVYDDHAVILTIKHAGTFIVPRDVRGVPVTDVAVEAFDSISDLDDLQIYGPAGSGIYDFAVKNDLCFYAFYEGGDIEANIPGASSSPAERESSAMERLTAPDANDSINALTAQYLTDGTGYEDLCGLVYFQYVCANNMLMFEWSSASYYGMQYTNKTRTVVRFDGDGGEEYHLCEKVKYGDLKTYDALEQYLRLHFSPDIAERILAYCVNVNGELFHVVDRQFGATPDTNIHTPVISLDVEADRITLTAKRGVYTLEESDGEVTEVLTGEYRTDEYVLENENGVWRWTVFPEDALYGCCEEYLSGTYSFE